jgi:two-component sensor histidine kinase
VHTILSLSSWQGAELSKLIEEELAPYALGGQIELSGPPVQLMPATAQTLALALHELFTNSAKYGALSTREGRLAISWQVANEMLALVWEESDGPQVSPPKERGFGTKSLLASVESQLGGEAQFDWRAEGLVCRLQVPLTRKVTATVAAEKFDASPAEELQRASG